VKHSWPGNIRELQNFIERSVILSSGNVLQAPLGDLGHSAKPELKVEMSQTLDEAQRDHIRRTLEQTRGVVGGPGGAAERLGLKRTTLYARMQKLGISRSDKSRIAATSL